ncbi:MAG: alpha-methylacyl-CoA racemase [Gammaproteobacteria bacterium]|jgi:alpha-methylacyl-CoA racemase
MAMANGDGDGDGNRDSGGTQAPASAMKLGEFLRGVRVLDLSHYISGPLASLALADMGAEVLKIEPPSGDGLEQVGPRDAQGRALFYASMNAGKSALRLDLKDPAQRQRLLALVAEVDVLIEGFRPGVMSRLGIDYEFLRTVNPALIYCSINGYGDNTSLVNKAAHDANYLAEAGVLDRNGTDRPVYFDPPIADVCGGLYAALAILGAVIGCRRSGQGTCIDLGLADVAMPLQQFQLADFAATGFVPKRGQTYLNGGAAYYNIYASADGQHVVIGAIEAKFWRAFCVAAQRPQWIDRQHEAIPQRALIGDVAAFIASLSGDECDARFAQVDCCYSKVESLDTALSSAHFVERQLVRSNIDNDLQALFPAWVGGEPPASRHALLKIDASSTTTPWRTPRWS